MRTWGARVADGSRVTPSAFRECVHGGLHPASWRCVWGQGCLCPLGHISRAADSGGGFWFCELLSVVSCEPQFPRLLGRRKGSSPPAGGGSRGLAEPHGAARRRPYHRVHVNRMIPGLITSSLRVFPRPLFLSVVLPVTVGSG